MLSGGLNLLAPGDAVNPGQALACDNFRTDQAGILRTRMGELLVHNFGAGNNVHTISTVLALTQRRYYGVGVDLWRDTATKIATGFDGNPLGMVSFQGRLWCMNQANQVKDDGTNVYPWGVAAPTAAPTAVIPLNAPIVTMGGAGTGSLNGSFEYYVTGILAGVESLPSLAQATDYLTTDSATIGQPDTWSSASTYSIGDVVAYGALRYVSLTAGNVNNEPDISPLSWSTTATNTAWSSQGFDHWNVYRHDRTAELAGGTPNDTAYLVNTTPIAIATTTLADSGAAVISGNASISLGLNLNYNYYVTGITAYAEETNPSPVLFCPTLEDGWQGIIAPAFADPQIIGWNIYRSGGAFPLQPYRINAATIPLATTTYYDFGVVPQTGYLSTYTSGEDQSDVGIAEQGLQMAVDHDPPPPARGLAGPYFSELLAFNSLAHPNRLWWTDTDEPTFFPGSQSEQDGNWVDIGEEGEAIVAIAVFPRWVAVLKERSFWRLVGDPATAGADLERTNAEVGQLGTQAWAIAGALVYGQAQEYILSFNGDKATPISPGLAPLFKGDIPLQPEAIPSAILDQAQRSAAVMAYVNGRLYFSYTELQNPPLTANNRTLVYNNGEWASDSRGFSALYYEGQGGMLLGAINGTVYQLEPGGGGLQGDDDWGNAIAQTYQSRYEDQGQPENRKRYSDILIEHNTMGLNFEVTAYLENGTTVVPLGSIQSNAGGDILSNHRTQTTFTLPDGEYRNISIRLYSADDGGNATIFAVILHYIVLERNACTYDSEKVPLPKLSLLNALELDLEILSGSVSYSVFVGTTALAVLATGTYTGAALGTFQVILPDGTQARWVRIILSGDNYRCRGARLQFQTIGAELIPAPPSFILMPIGTDSWLDPLTQNPRVSQGTLINSFTWDSGKVPLNKLSLLNGLEMGLEILGGQVNGTFTYGTTDLATAIPYTFTDPGDVQIFVEQIPDTTTARWVRLILQGDNWRFHGARLQLQEIGVEQQTMPPGIISLAGGQGAQGVFINAFTFDSGKIELDKLSLLNAVEISLDILAGTTVNYQFFYGLTDLNSIVNGSLTGTVAAFVEILTGEIQARWVRLIVQGDNYRWHGARLQLQPIGPELTPRSPTIISLSGGGEPEQGVFVNSRTWDSGKVALDKVHVFQALELELEIVSGNVNFTLETGIADNVLSTLSTGLHAATDVRTFTTALNYIEARWYRLILNGPNFRCHGARLQVQPIGVYLAGAADMYRSGDITLGSPRVKLLQQIRVDCHPDGAIPGAFLTDSPAPFAQRMALALVQSATRGWQRINLPRDTRGRVLRVEFTGAAVCRIYAIQVRSKVLGEGEGSWQWLDMPVDPTPPGFSWIAVGL